MTLDRRALFSLIVTAIISTSQAVAQTVELTDYTGPETVEIDLLRPSEGGSRILVQAGLPDGSLGLFMIDTGADISVLTQGVSDQLGLNVDKNWGVVEGLSGNTSMHRAVIPSIRLGDAVVEEVEVAVGLAGVRDQVAGMPFAGILGNNVWSRFTLEIDYPADTLVLHRPGSFRAPKRSGLLIFDGSHILTPVKVTTRSKPSSASEIIIQVDTGASELLLSGRTGLAFEDDYTEGLEPLWGIGASETLPPYRFLQRTRRVPVKSVEYGGQKVKTDVDARWVNFDTLSPVGPTSMRGLLGHRLLADYNVIIDYHSAQIALTKSKRKPRSTNAHQLLLDQDIAMYGDRPDRYLLRAQLTPALSNTTRVKSCSLGFSTSSRITRKPESSWRGCNVSRGNLTGAWETIRHLNVEGMVDESEIVAAVNGLILNGAKEDAFLLADDATNVRGGDGWSHVALADALLSKGFPERARRALLDAAKLEENPDAHLLRRARVAAALGDRHGAMAHIRKLVQLYPSGGPFIWYYALLIQDSTEIKTFLSDTERAMARLHPGRRPFDFLVASYSAIGDQKASLEALDLGLARDCAPMTDKALMDNCHAWYWSLAGVKTDDALRRIEAALAKEGPRSDFLDTKAMVHLARGEHQLASETAAAAARMSPQDVYMLWQAERLNDIAQQQADLKPLQ